MTRPSTHQQIENWQTLYTANRAHWKDLKRLGGIFMPLFLGIFVATMYVVFFLYFIEADRLAADLRSMWAFRRYFVILSGVLIVPLVVSMVGFFLLTRYGKSFFNAFYKVDEDFNSGSLIRRRFLGIPPFPPSSISSTEYPHVIISAKGEIKEEEKWVKWLGGPANLVIADGVAVYLERGNKFSRVVGSGIVFLESFETVRAVVQLTPQKKDVNLKASTKDGIPISMKARIVFQVGINPIAHARPENRMYPLDPVAVKKAVERTTLRYEDEYKEAHWYDSVWGQVNGPLRQYITCHSLNEFFVTDTDKENTLPDLVQQRLFNEVTPKLAEQGIRLLELQITELKPPEAIDKQRLQNWEAIRKGMSTIREAESKAYQIRMTETARAIAQRDMILAIAEGLDKMDQEHLEEPLLLSLSAILDRSLEDSYTRSLIANDALTTLENLKKVLWINPSNGDKNVSS